MAFSSQMLQRVSFGALKPCVPVSRLPRRKRLQTRVLGHLSVEPRLPFWVKSLSLVLMDDLEVAHKYGGTDGLETISGVEPRRRWSVADKP